MALTDFTHVPPTRSMMRMIAPIFIVVFCFCAICAYVLIDARRATLDRAAEGANSLVKSVEADILRSFDTVDLSLQGVIENLNHPDLEQLSPELRHRFLFERLAMARNLGRILVTDTAGNVHLNSEGLNAPMLNLADRDFFRAQKMGAASGLYIGAPSISRAGGYRFIGISRRLSYADGSFAGAVVASMRLSYFQNLFKNIVIGPNGSITLMRTDGVVIMRWPYKDEYIGANIHGAKLFEKVAASRSGRFESSVVDGHNRLIVYSQIGELPLVVGVGQSTDDIYAQWDEYAFAISFMVALLCSITIGLAMYLAQQFNRRREAEAKLAILASTDGLTSLANRRHFNDTLLREWQRAAREKVPLSLLMIDADKFKTYNDTHGHLAGDIMLNTLGAAIHSASERAGDMGARFGGDEFSILLPGTPLEGAERVAEKLRSSFADLCEREGMAPLGLSIGIACVMPGADLQPGELVGLADLALYRAKELGRNRTEVAIPVPDELAPAVPTARHMAA